MPSFSNFTYRVDVKSLTIRSVQTMAIVGAALLASVAASKTSADEVTRWNQIATDATTVADTNPLRESCVFAILHVAIHDAVNAVEWCYEPYLLRTSQAPGASVEVASASAAHFICRSFLPMKNSTKNLQPKFQKWPSLGASRA